MNQSEVSSRLVELGVDDSNVDQLSTMAGLTELQRINLVGFVEGKNVAQLCRERSPAVSRDTIMRSLSAGIQKIGGLNRVNLS